MYNQKQQTPGYYRALRENRKLLNKRKRRLDDEISLLIGQKEKYSNSKDKIINTILKMKNANILRRFLFFITGDVKRLV